ncbi:hypothetical protein BDW69DRAFT_200297 [Aspergillus filifer]
MRRPFPSPQPLNSNNHVQQPARLHCPYNTTYTIWRGAKPLTLAQTPPSARGPGRSGPRRRTGCLTCRARKVRCDEGKPNCANCTRLRLQCQYKSVIIPGIRTRGRKPGRARSGSSATVEMEMEMQASPRSNSTPNLNSNSNLEGIHTGQHHFSGQTQSATLPPTNEAQPASTDFPIPFDMLGFIGEITSDFQQKHLDLTNGGTVASAAAVPMAEVYSDHINERQIPWAPVQEDSIEMGVLREPSETPRQSATDSSELYEKDLLEYFREAEPPPTIFAPVDLEWPYVRAIMLSESSNCRALLLSIYCYADMHKSWIDGRSWKMGPTYHAQASSEIEALLIEDLSEGLLKRVIMGVLLLKLAELVSRETWRPPTPFLQTAYLLIQRFHDRTKSWTGLAHLVNSWVELLDIKSLIAGREGDTLADLGSPNAPLSIFTPKDQLSNNHTATTTSGTPSVSDPTQTDDLPPPPPTYHITHSILSPAYTFFLRTQQLTRRIITIDLHHRSRGTVSDEFEVLQIAHTVSADLESLWSSRPNILDLYISSSTQGSELCTILAPRAARNVIRTFRSYVANFLALFIYLHRVAFAIYPRTDRVNRAVERIMVLAREETATSISSHTGTESGPGQKPELERQSVPTSFIWPLFIAALEGSLEQRRWITAEMQRMADLAPGAGRGRSQRHPNVGKALVLLEEMTRRQDASRTWADSRCVRRELFVDFFVMI